MSWVDVSVSDPNKGNVGRAVVSRTFVILPYPCSSTTDCTYYLVTLKKPGKYLLETWGSQGGNDTSSPTTTFGGRGGYSKGILTINKTQTLYAYVGGAGTGDARSDSGSSGGGGATDFRLTPGDWNFTEGLNSRILVSGGGGGRHGEKKDSSSAYIGNDGGGSTAPTYVVTSYGQTVTTFGATPLSGGSSSAQQSYGTYVGSFGFANPNQQSNMYSIGGFNGGSRGSDCWACGGAGGGWWGGCTSWPAGSGGSGFVLNQSTIPKDYPISPLFYLLNGDTIPGNEEFNSPFGNLERGHHGNGIAKITFLSYLQATNRKNYSVPFFHFVTFVSLYS